MLIPEQSITSWVLYVDDRRTFGLVESLPLGSCISFDFQPSSGNKHFTYMYLTSDVYVFSDPLEMVMWGRGAAGGYWSVWRRDYKLPYPMTAGDTSDWYIIPLHPGLHRVQLPHSCRRRLISWTSFAKL